MPHSIGSSGPDDRPVLGRDIGGVNTKALGTTSTDIIPTLGGEGAGR